MDDQAQSLSISPMPDLRQPLVDNDGVGSSRRHCIDSLLQIDQARHRPQRYPMVHGNDHRPS